MAILTITQLKPARFAVLLALGACTLGGGGLNGLVSNQDPVGPAQNDPARLAAIERLGMKLKKQKTAIQQNEANKKNTAVQIANLRPEKQPDTARLITKSTVGKPSDFVAKSTVREVAIIPPIQPAGGKGGPLGRFHAKLAALKAGARSKPITILHIGDSHIASDSFSRGIRTALQAQYGDAGRGMVIPAKAFKYGVADQVKLSALGRWRGQTASKQKRGRYGISGVSVSSRSSRSSMTLQSKNGRFDWAGVTVATGPSQGAFTMKVGKVSKRFDAYSKRKGSKQFHVTAKGRTLVVVPGGGAQTTLLNWSTGKNRPGIRYVNFGLIGATLNITKRFNTQLVANDVRRLDPDLIIYGYGTNEGFNDGLKLSSYRKRASRYVARLKKNAPNADVIYLGAASGLRRRGNGVCGGWSTPPKLGPLRTAVRKLASSQGAAYWDWSRSMGGVCAVNKWAGQGLAAKDRVHLTSKGYRRSAAAFTKWLISPSASNVAVALNK
ncbi:MAG: GDSL-type esterase/lipase family protein [Rhizobiaceae bacterium]